MKIFDISIPTSARTTVFPGDPAPIIHWPGWTHERGNPANVGFFNGGLHHGTHVDAPWHFIPGGKRIHQLPLDTWVGPAEVVDITRAERCVTAADLDAANLPKDARRLLFKTRNGLTDYWEQPWNPDFIHIDESAAQWCKDHGIILVALDYLTVDPPTRPEFPAHLILLGNGIVIVENIILRDIPAGRYILHAAPVKIEDGDGAWCRAYLTTPA